jgi:limonene-1,2-epoxide hydrolase
VSPEDVVLAELKAWGSGDAEEITSYFAPGAIWENVPIGVVRGREEIRRSVEGYLAHIAEMTIEVLNIASAGNVVLTERIDHFVWDGKSTAARCMGAFEVSGDKIVTWRDYFDRGH